MTLRKLFDAIYVDTEGANGGNYGAIVLDDEILMIDSGMIHTKSRASREFLEFETGLPVTKLVFTHSHSDHVFGAQAFEPVQIICSETMRKNYIDRLQHEWKLETLLERYSQAKNDNPALWDAVQTLSIRLPDIVFENELSLSDNKPITAKIMGGHTSGSTIVISKEDSTVFVGDLIFSDQFPYGGDPTCNPDRWIEALKEIRAEHFETIIPGHGPVCGYKELEEYIEALTELRQNIMTAIEREQSVQSFMHLENIPNLLKAGFERFGEITLKHWFEYYS
jgi:cyclase